MSKDKLRKRYLQLILHTINTKKAKISIQKSKVYRYLPEEKIKMALKYMSRWSILFVIGGMQFKTIVYDENYKILLRERQINKLRDTMFMDQKTQYY